MPTNPMFSTDRLIFLGDGCAPIPERLLLAHARGQVLFITGAGTSLAANLPDFRNLVLLAYEKIDAATYKVISKIPIDWSKPVKIDLSKLIPQQQAEVRRFIQRDYDVVLGMLERRIDGVGGASFSVRKVIDEILRTNAAGPATIHRSLIKLADRGGAVTLITTNFDLLLEKAAQKIRPIVQSYNLGAIPRPSRKRDFSGIFHIHGALERNPNRIADMVLTDHDFGEFYLRRRNIPDFIYDAARLFHIVLVGYSANDPPMRYLLNAVAADGSRFDDLKERFAFIGGPASPDTALLEDWKGRGITPIPYNSAHSHIALDQTLAKWAEFSAINGSPRKMDTQIKKIVKKTRLTATDPDKDFFDHLFRRANITERTRIAKLASVSKAHTSWLEAMDTITKEQT